MASAASVASFAVNSAVERMKSAFSLISVEANDHSVIDAAASPVADAASGGAADRAACIHSISSKRREQKQIDDSATDGRAQTRMEERTVEQNRVAAAATAAE